MSFSKINEVLDVPNLIEVQKNSYSWFLKEGIKEVFADISPITDSNGKLALSFINYRIDDKPKYTIAECKERDVTYAAPLKVLTHLRNEETGEVIENEIFMGDFPLMTDSGTFVINGAERVIVSQLVRSPGVYFGFDYDKTGKKLFKATIIPNRGAWLEYEMDSNDIFYVRIDKNRKIPATALIRALGKGTDDDIFDLFGEDERLVQTVAQKDATKNNEEALLEVYKKLRPGEPPTVESAQNHIDTLFFDAKRYDLSRFGRYKYNKKLGVASRIVGHKAGQPIIVTITGELLVSEGEVITLDKALEIEQAGIMEVLLDVDGLSETAWLT
jgi:DNA-directed RNA polymerase subunit beta